MKKIAYYLPQFHEIDENNRAWGTGFTEWDNVRTAYPLFPEHNQPREPLGDNYYNLLNVETIQWQATLAKKYGVDGFCFYHYWFKDGKTVLEKPCEILLANTEIDIEFCFSWANEPWTKTWHGASGEKEVLLDQKYGKEDLWRKHFMYLLSFFKDSRYIKIENKPVFLIYQINKIGCFNKMIDLWNALARENGFDGIYVVDMLTADGKIAQNKRVLASVDFEPGKSKRKQLQSKGELGIQDYDDSCKRMLSQNHTKNEWRCVFVDYDDTPRRHEKGLVYKGSTPEKFGQYLQASLKKAKEEQSEFLFINAWNEWGESNYLEPDKKNGYAYLEAVKKADCGAYEDVILDEEYSSNTIVGSESAREAKYRQYYELCNQWIKLKNDGYCFKDYFETKGYQSIAVYGMGELANRFVEELDGSGIQIKYGIDKDVSQAFAEIDIVSFDEWNGAADVDCIVVTPIHIYEKIKESLQTKTQCNICSIEDVLRSL